MCKSRSAIGKFQPSKTNKQTKNTEALALKNRIAELKNSIESLKSRFNHTEEHLKPVDSDTGNFPKKKKDESHEETLQELEDRMKRNNICIMGNPEEEEKEKRTESIC